MSYTVVNPGGPKARPGTVSTASMLLYLAAALMLVYGALGVVSYFAIRDVINLTEDLPPELAATSTTIGVVIGSVLYVVLAAGFGTLAIFVGKGSHPARIVTWVLASIVVLCCGCGLLSDVFTSALLDDLAASSGSGDIIAQTEAAIPAWLNVVTAVVGVVIILATAATIVLLALPASNDYFRKEQEVWVPPTYPGEGMGGYPPPPPPPSGPAGPPWPPGPPPPSGPPPPGPPPPGPPQG